MLYYPYSDFKRRGKEVYVDTATIVVLAVGGYFLVTPLVAPLVWRAAALIGNLAFTGGVSSIAPGDDIRFDQATNEGKIILAILWIVAVFFIAVFGVIAFMRLLFWIGMKISGQ